MNPEPLIVWPLGDSITLGVSNPVGLIPGYRGTLFNDLNIFGAGLNNFVGSLFDAPSINQFLNRDSHHDGNSGFKIEQITALVPTVLPTIAKPDITLLLIGTNNAFAGQTGTDMLGKLSTLLQLLLTSLPRKFVLVSSIPLCPGFETARDTYNAGIGPLVTSINNPFLQYINACGNFTSADQGTLPGPTVDPHPNAQGYAKIAAAWFNAIIPIANFLARAD